MVLRFEVRLCRATQRFFHPCGCSTAHACWCPIRRDGGECGECRNCKKNLAVLRATGIAGDNPCFVSKAVEDEAVVNGIAVKYHLACIDTGRPPWLRLAAAECVYLWYCHRVAVDVISQQQRSVAELESRLQMTESVLMDCYSGAWADDDTFQSDIIHEGISQKIQVIALKELLPTDIARQQAAIKAALAVQAAARHVLADGIASAMAWVLRCWRERVAARNWLMYLRKRDHAVLIQRAVRHWLWRFRDALHLYLRRCVIRIQRWVRRRWDIRGYLLWRQHWRQHMAVVHLSATRIQAVVRGWEYRRFFEPHFGKTNVRQLQNCMCCVVVCVTAPLLRRRCSLW